MLHHGIHQYYFIIRKPEWDILIFHTSAIQFDHVLRLTMEAGEHIHNTYHYAKKYVLRFSRDMSDVHAGKSQLKHFIQPKSKAGRKCSRRTHSRTYRHVAID